MQNCHRLKRSKLIHLTFKKDRFWNGKSYSRSGAEFTKAAIGASAAKTHSVLITAIGAERSEGQKSALYVEFLRPQYWSQWPDRGHPVKPVQLLMPSAITLDSYSESHHPICATKPNKGDELWGEHGGMNSAKTRWVLH
jgi:hypothetical protein